MALPKTYLTSSRNLDGILSAIQTAQAPTRFTLSFLENLGYKSSSDRLIINVLKSLGFLTGDGAPTDRYYRFLDQVEAPRVLAEGVREAYADLFQLNRNAQTLSRSDVKNKVKTLTQGQASDDVANKMANTFLELAKRADFDALTRQDGSPPPVGDEDGSQAQDDDETPPPPTPPSPSGGTGLAIGGLVYSIQIHLPDTRDQAVYDALFRSLKSHLLQ